MRPLTTISACALLFLATLFSCSKKSTSAQGPTTTTYAWDKFVMGADLSFNNALDDHGAVLRDSGLPTDVYRIMRKHGCNLVRVRLWHTPSWQKDLFGGKYYSDLADVERTIRRAKDAGMAVNLDFHYSDDWADPQKQETPAAWQSLSLQGLRDSIYAYTLSTLNELKGKGLTPEMVQVGNETNNGMCWPLGKVTGGDFSAFASLLNSGIRAVRDFSAVSSMKPLIILHEAQLTDAEYWTRGIMAAGVTDFDILGLSHYYKWDTINDMGPVQQKISALKAITGKKVMVVETAFSFTNDNADSYPNIMTAPGPIAGFAVTRDGQYAYMKALTQAIISGGGSGLMYWEPAWITSSLSDRWGTGSSWENNTLFDFTGNALPAIDFMQQPYAFPK